MKAQLLMGVGAKSRPDFVVLNRQEVTGVSAPGMGSIAKDSVAQDNVQQTAFETR
jgi:hypothetical protein